MHLVERCMRVLIIMTVSTHFTNFIETLTNSKKMLISSKYIEMINFHELLDLFINIHEAITDERKDRK